MRRHIWHDASASYNVESGESANKSLGEKQSKLEKKKKDRKAKNNKYPSILLGSNC